LITLQIIILAIVQGITEFLPISSSGHLILVPELTDWPDQGVIMDVGVHVGTLFAVILYFRHDVWRMVTALWQLLIFKKDHDESERLILLMVILATIPIVIIGGIAAAYDLPDMLRTIEIIGWTSIIFGLLLYWYDKHSPANFDLSNLKYGHAITIGLAQILSLIPGTSRSGITMTAARAIGFSRTDAARFSMLLSIPTILAAGSLQILKLLAEPQSQTASVNELLWGAALAFISAILAISALMKWLKRSSMTPFVIYRVALGCVLLFIVYG